MARRNEENGEKGLLWKLPVLKTKSLGKIGPGIGYGAGCGVGFGIGLVGGAGLGAGIPGLQLGFGIGAGCGIGVGFGYGVGRGVAYDDRRKYSNVGKMIQDMGSFPSREEIIGLIDELAVNTKRMIKATSREIEKWRSGSDFR